jgi:glucose/arabinose dehydrogenase/cytochrome c551/c552
MHRCPTLFPRAAKRLGAALLVAACLSRAVAQDKADTALFPQESDFYPIQTLPVPEGIELGVGGMALLPDGRLAVCTRRGKVWIISNPCMKDSLPPRYSLFAEGLHEPLGLAYHQGALYVAQRPELTRLRDVNGDGIADEYKTIYRFPVSGNYHEYAYGPVFDRDGNMLVTLNLGWFGNHMESRVPWRGWMLKITPDGKMTPVAAGLRSPAAFTITAEGHIFYAENQGRWVGSGHVTEVEPGDFLGHPASLRWSGLPGSNVHLKEQDIPDGGKPEFEVAAHIPGLKTPSVWVPHAIMGVSTSGLLIDDKGQMGPFKGQFFVGDQGESLINRIFFEKVKGVYQGAVFPFRRGFSSGVLRLAWAADGSMFVGMTARGWGSAGGGLFGLQRLVWNGKVPFEMQKIEAEPDGFRLVFTRPVDRKTARDPASYVLSSFTYMYHSVYGSPVIDKRSCPVRAIEVSADGMSVRLAVDSLRQGYIHEIRATGLRSVAHHPLLHSMAYYTLNRIPDGLPMKITAENRVRKPVASAVKAATARRATAGGPAKAAVKGPPSFGQVRPLLVRYTCLSCHDPLKRHVGPPYREVASRKYPVEKIMRLIRSPNPGHWPDYATPMPPMPNVPASAARKIALWINSLDK